MAFTIPDIQVGQISRAVAARERLGVPRPSRSTTSLPDDPCISDDMAYGSGSSDFDRDRASEGPNMVSTTRNVSYHIQFVSRVFNVQVLRS